MRAIVGAVIGGHVDNRRWPKSPARLLAPRMARRGAKTARCTGATPANGARYEDTRVDRRTAFCGVARGSAADAWYKRPDKHINTAEYRALSARRKWSRTFCNVASGPNNAGYGTHGGAAATSTGITTPSKAIPACGEGVVPANELCN